MHFFFIETDASNIAIGALLLQYHQGKLLPVAYYSKKLNYSEHDYTVHGY